MPAPAGYSPHASGLLVPDAVARRREVWTKAEWKLVERTALLLDGHGVAHLMRCRRPDCPSPTLDLSRLPDGDGRMRCGCTDRILTRAR